MYEVIINSYAYSSSYEFVFRVFTFGSYFINKIKCTIVIKWFISNLLKGDNMWVILPDYLESFIF